MDWLEPGRYLYSFWKGAWVAMGGVFGTRYGKTHEVLG
jgi:hypothetical protein